MIPKIKKILYTTDLSLNSAYVFRYALNSAIKHDAKIDILHVLEPVGVFIGASSEDTEQSRIETIKKRIKSLTEKDTESDPSIIDRVSEIRVIKKENPATVILNAVKELKPDILIMGTHSKGVLGNALLGSVAIKVLQKIKIPVYIIPIPDLPESYVRWLRQHNE
ncbi:MAG TPA: universal stress protein [Deltaproteobacteria bacterium]|nr:universal stress protein [Deltaproteobacteria bacterium]HXK47783.1 universal stress protein [Deltaproteobacteria bacterium]